MDGRVVSSVKVQQKVAQPTITGALASAVLEWCLIFLLFIGASFSYFVTKFAHYCQLQIPCLLCSRLDHVLGKEKAGFYWDLICSNHKLKISSLVLCHLHDNLVDVHGMCESCLFSFATVNKSNSETYRLLVGKLGDEPHFGLDQDSLLADDSLSSLNGRKCSCCEEQCISGGRAQMLFQTRSIGYEAADLDVPLLETNGNDRDELMEIKDVSSQKVRASLSDKVNITSDTGSEAYESVDLHAPLLATSGNDRDELMEIKDVSSQKVRASPSDKNNIDPLPHVEYEKVNMTSDTESDAYEAADLHAPLMETSGNDKDELTEIKDVSSDKIQASLSDKNDINPLPHVEYEKVKVTSDTESEASFSNDDSSSNLIHESKYCKKDFATVGREEDLVTDDLASERLIDPEVVPQHSIMDSELRAQASDLHCISQPAPTGHGLGELNWQNVEHNTDASAPSDLISFSDVLPSFNVTQSSVDEAGETLEVKAVAEMGKEAAKDRDEMDEFASNSNATNGKQSDLRSAMSDTSSQIPSFLELGDAYKLAVGSKGRQLSGKLLEQKTLKDSASVSEDLKILLSQLSAARGFELPVNDMSPRISGNVDEFRTSDASSSKGMQLLQKRISLERNESSISLDGSTVSEIEGESVVDRLKRQVEHDRKLMGALYKELEEERNASAIAANQAMAMITRLQEEKAALNLEALQCLRMMEEQAEYDGEALQKANDLLAVKEREIHNLEGELQVCKKKFGDISCIKNLVEPDFELNIREITGMQLEASPDQRNTSVCNSGHSMPATCSEIDETANLTGDQDRNTKSSLEFEDEIRFILQCLKILEKKLELFSTNEAIVDRTDGDSSVEENVKVSDGKQLDSGKASLKNDETNVDCVLEHAFIHDERHSALERSSFQHEDPQCASKGNGGLKPGLHFYMDIELDALKNEFLVLSARLEALKAEHSFLENSMSSLSKGNEGLKFVQEIASQVRELYSIGIKRRN